MSTTAQCYYTAARDEVLLRLRLRDQVLLAYTVAGSSVIGLSLSDITSIGNTVALIVPFLAVGASILISAHSIAITHLGSYTVKLKDAIDSCRVHKEVAVEPWDYSEVYMYYSEKNSGKRLSGHIFVICIPAIFSLIVTFDQVVYPFTLHSVLWLCGVCLVVWSLYVLANAHIVRKREIDSRVHTYELKKQRDEAERNSKKAVKDALEAEKNNKQLIEDA